jgi:hypothetical protein
MLLLILIVFIDKIFMGNLFIFILHTRMKYSNAEVLLISHNLINLIFLQLHTNNQYRKKKKRAETLPYGILDISLFFKTVIVSTGVYD